MNASEPQVTAAPRASPQEPITVGKVAATIGAGHHAEVFTMTLGGETINLLPWRNWSQLDVYKWRARGVVPGTPAGLEITLDHVKVTGEVVSTKDSGGAARLQRLLNQWLASARGHLELAQHKVQAKAAPAAQEAPAQPQSFLPRFRVEVDREGHVHIKCLQGKEMLALIGLNLPGINSLISQGLMHKPHALLVGALHDWVELDGEFFSFEKGNDDSAKLEKALNERYLSTAALGEGKEVVVFANAASSTGFDIQFAAKMGGIVDHRRRPLNEDSLALLQDHDRCGLLPKDLVIKLSPPNLIFKRKTADGGETYLNPGPESMVTVTGEEGEVKTINLSRPVSYLRLSALDLTAVFNHPAVNQHSTVSPLPGGPSQRPGPVPAAVQPVTEPPAPPPLPVSQSKPQTAAGEAPPPETGASQPGELAKPDIPKPIGGPPIAPRVRVVKLVPNLWLETILRRTSVRHDWFTCLVYSKMAEHFGNSGEGYFGPIPCWASSLGDVADICDPAFRGVFITQKGGLGYLHQGHLARFHNEVAFVGTLESMIEGVGVSLVATGTDSQQRIFFIVTEGYRAQFGVQDQTVAEELARLRKHGALVMSPSEVLHSADPIDLVWTVPPDQEDTANPQAVVHIRPGCE